MSGLTDWTTNVGLSASRRPVLLDGEVEALIQEGVAIYEGENVSKFDKGILTLTTHRLIWVDQSSSNIPTIALNLGQIADADADAGAWNPKASAKIKITLLGRDKNYYKLSFRASGRDNFLTKFKTCLKNRAWEKAVAAAQPKKKEGFETSKAGVTGIMRIEEKKAKDTDQTLQQAFSDISALMDKAKDMVAIAEKIATTASKENKEEDSELRSVLLSMGISSPVTKQNAGSLYHEQLSRQLADWIQRPLDKLGGMIAMTDLYCIFNRARGTEMISPDDLYRACVLFEELNVPVRLRRFDSGVLVVQSLNNSDQAISKQVADAIKISGPQTAFDIARAKNVSIALATEQLLTAERMGAICRDETYEGTTFYLNFFADRNLLQLYIRP